MVLVLVAGVVPSFDGGFDLVRLLQISTCLRACLVWGWGGELSSSISTSPGGAVSTRCWPLVLFKMWTLSRRCVHFIKSHMAVPGRSYAPSQRSWRGSPSIRIWSLVPVAGWPSVFCDGRRFSTSISMRESSRSVYVLVYPLSHRRHFLGTGQSLHPWVARPLLRI